VLEIRTAHNGRQSIWLAPDGVGKRAYAAMEKAFYDEDMW